MELTTNMIIVAVTLFLGQLTKKLGWIDKKYIPWQNLVIGLISGVICWVCELEANLPIALVKCVVASYAAGGAYDNLTVGKVNEEFHDNVGGEE